MRRLVCVIGMAMLAAGTVAPGARAAAICIKPLVPACMNDTTTFVSADKMQSCQFEVKDYVDKTMAYLTCVSDEHKATGQELTRNVERFNCRLSGRQNCG
ncbi:MAG TPA: hypothetical protein VD860_09810 [Azospirillum sp.]|nr:hypothetical protein [Azospirillum sp.]